MTLHLAQAIDGEPLALGRNPAEALTRATTCARAEDIDPAVVMLAGNSLHALKGLLSCAFRADALRREFQELGL